MNFAGLVRDKAETKAWLTSLLESGESLLTVGAKLGLANMPTEKLMLHPNWKALVKFQRMKFEHTYGKKLPYAKFGTGYQTEEKTKEELMKWIMAGTSRKDVRKTLGLTNVKTKIDLISQRLTRLS
ncbi:hypothetical protein GN244_ATG12233 [Phytophthora infestans]|uniref:Uncharacterized protein n=1 Tax=Phytophthora infestans TaxID=4787 RepID=A0A833T2C0_PHYIN|nr:hypothetical protein GN244_ATG12233 [Phytophthora infestans]KAF4146473.1 hypothetical protein GN958_ATG04338 [Phytophthora infestans]